MHAHNLFLQVAVDLGVPGLIGWLAVYGSVILTAWTLFRVGKSRRDGWLMGIGAGMVGGQLALGTHGILDAVTWGQVRPAPLVWFLWGLTIAAGYVYLWGQRDAVPAAGASPESEQSTGIEP
jgi:putative inorganic carbon (HCO3(-)) transporter